MTVINRNYVLWLLQMAIRLHAKKVLRIVGGQDGGDLKIHQNIVRMEAKVTMPPVLAELHDSVAYTHVCTATVIKPVWVLTAGHCIEEFEKLIITLAPHNLNPKGVIRYGSGVPWTNDSFSDIVALIKHPSYKLLYRNTVDIVKNDIGLMKTAPIHLDQYGKLSAVDYRTLYGQEAIAAGYGITSHGDVYADTLVLNKTLQVSKFLVSKCTEKLLVAYPGLCLRRLCGRAAAVVCPGDSGGPLLHPSGVVGVTSIGQPVGCFSMKTQHNWFAISTPVSPYIDWITIHIRKN